MLIKTLGLGGAERFVGVLSRSLVDRGHEVVVVYSLASPDTLRRPLESYGAIVYRVDATPAGFVDVWKILVKELPDVVHAHSPLFKVWARLICRKLGIRLVTTYHNVLSRHGLVTRLAEALTHQLDDVRISCSEEVARSMLWSSEVVPNGIRLQHSSRKVSGGLRDRFGIGASTLVFVCVASLTKKKNHAMLISAFCDAFDVEVRDGPHLVLFGDGEQRGALERQVESIGVRNRVHFAGADPDASVFAREADIFCLVSNYEGLPLALLEAMSSSLPSIVTDVGEMGTVVLDGKTGIVVPAGDSGGVVRAMRSLAADKTLRESMGAAALLRVAEHYGSDSMVDRLEEIYLRGRNGADC